ncbi:unnamed protein product [Arabidopsis lyrata]|nr:unnamed protein product [Arabidopsis lyrata]
MENNNQKRFVLVHGVCHGAWTWDKVKTQLEAAGHCVTAVDLAASGLNMTRVEEIQTLKDYCKPLLEFLSSLGSDDDKVILVAHSMGGIPAALAADIYASRSIPQEEWLDTECGTYGTPDCPLQSTLLGPKFMAKKMYQHSPVQDLELVKTLVRTNPIVTNNLAGTRSFSEEGYGSVTRIYIVCGEDLVEPEDYQRWMITNFPPKEVMEIKCADHMPMFSKPQEVCALLLEIADKYCQT